MKCPFQIQRLTGNDQEKIWINRRQTEKEGLKGFHFFSTSVEDPAEF